MKKYFQGEIIRIAGIGDLNAGIDSEPFQALIVSEGQQAMSQMWLYMDGHITDRVATDSSAASEACDVCILQRARFLCPLRLEQVGINVY